MSLDRNARIEVVKRTPKWGTPVAIWAELSDSFALHTSLDDPDMVTLTHIRSGRHVHTSDERSCRALLNLLQAEPIDWDFDAIPPTRKASIEMRVNSLKTQVAHELKRSHAA